MNRYAILIVAAVVAAGFAHAVPQETRSLDASAEGIAADTQTGETFDVAFDLAGDVVVTQSGEGVDRTAFSQTPATATVTIDGTEYSVPVTVSGEGVSLVQTGVTADGWRLSAQGSSVPAPGETSVATLRGSLILLGTDDGYALEGEGVLTVTDGDATTTYQLSYAGSATFE